VRQHHDDPGPEHRRAVFETRGDFRRRHVAGNAADKDVADGLIEHQFDRHPGIGAGEHRGERLLPLGRLFMQQLEVMFMGGAAAVDVALIAVHQLLQRSFRRQRALRQRRARRGNAAAQFHQAADGRRCRRRAQEASPRHPAQCLARLFGVTGMRVACAEACFAMIGFVGRCHLHHLLCAMRLKDTSNRAGSRSR